MSLRTLKSLEHLTFQCYYYYSIVNINISNIIILAVVILENLLVWRTILKQGREPSH